jgi:hypothetical protein
VQLLRDIIRIVCYLIGDIIVFIGISLRNRGSDGVKPDLLICGKEFVWMFSYLAIEFLVLVVCVFSNNW